MFRFANIFAYPIAGEGMRSCDVSRDIPPRGQEQIITSGKLLTSRLDHGGSYVGKCGCCCLTTATLHCRLGNTDSVTPVSQTLRRQRTNMAIKRIKYRMRLEFYKRQL